MAVLSEGVVGEQGTHAALMANPKGVYHNLMRRQLQGVGSSARLTELPQGEEAEVGVCTTDR